MGGCSEGLGEESLGGCSEGLGEGSLGGCSELASSSFTTVQVILGQGLIHCLSVRTVLGACISCIYHSGTPMKYSWPLTSVQV